MNVQTAMDKFNNKYRIPSARLQSWDYGSNGAYFITICTKYRQNFFGHIADGQMHLNAVGQLAEKYWMEIPDHFTFIELGNFVVMPNHTHGILIIDKMDNVNCTVPSTFDETINDQIIIVETTIVETTNDQTTNDESTIVEMPNVETPNLGVSTTTTGGKNDKWKPETIGVIINQYKRIVTIQARKIIPRFNWQSRFHDHIIRNAQSFENIQNYISNNPKNWGKDKFFGK